MQLCPSAAPQLLPSCWKYIGDGNKAKQGKQEASLDTLVETVDGLWVASASSFARSSFSWNTIPMH